MVDELLGKEDYMMGLLQGKYKSNKAINNKRADDEDEEDDE
jgi:hypothetical protein